MSPDQTKPSTSFWVISILALVWNLTGIMSFIMNVSMSSEALAALTDAQRELYESTPVWLKFVFGVAVFSGVLGCILLLMRKASAIRVFVVSLIAILIQMLYSLFMTNSFEVYGPSSIVMPIVVIGIGIFLVWYSRLSFHKRWLKSFRLTIIGNKGAIKYYLPPTSICKLLVMQ